MRAMHKDRLSRSGQVESIIALDLIRGLAALAVFLCHVRLTSFVEFGALPPHDKTALTAFFYAITRLGHEAVMVFFVLSGFLVGGALIRRVRAGTFDVIAYGIERTTRIMVPLVPACLLTIIIAWYFLGYYPSFWLLLINFVGLNGVIGQALPGNPPLWTLAYEIWFYISAGALAYLLGSRQPSLMAIFLVFCSVCVFSVLSAHYVLFWWLGALAVLFLNCKKRGLLAAIGSLILLVGVFGYQMTYDSKPFGGVSYFSAPISEAMICCGFTLAIPFLCDPKTSSALRFLRKPAVYLSSISYTLYLFHYPLNEAIDTLFPKATSLSWIAMGNFVARALLLLLLVQLCYFAFEARTPMVRRFVKSRWHSYRKWQNEEFLAPPLR